MWSSAYKLNRTKLFHIEMYYIEYNEMNSKTTRYYILTLILSVLFSCRKDLALYSMQFLYRHVYPYI